MLETKLKTIKLPQMNPELVANQIGEFIIYTIKKVNATGAVIGLSGGVDSTVTAALAKRAFDKYNQENPTEQLELVGYILPSKTNDKKETEDGIKVAEKLGIRYEKHSIEPIVQAYKHTNPEALNVHYHKGNLMSRIRANILSTKSAIEGKPVLGTGNKDEDFGVGYYTLFGDGAVHLSPIGNLSKRLVYEMARYLGFNEIAGKEPTAGLIKGLTDRSDLGYGYDVVELITEGLEQGFSRKELLEHPQVRSLISQQLADNYKFDTVKEIVDDVINRHCNSALPKAEIIHPPVAPVSLVYTGGKK